MELPSLTKRGVGGELFRIMGRDSDSYLGIKP